MNSIMSGYACEDIIAMQMQKKVTLKEDGRFLTYYHFAETATEEETAVFNAIVPIVPIVPTVPSEVNAEANSEGNSKPGNLSLSSPMLSEGSANV